MPVVPSRRVDKKKSSTPGWWSDKERMQAVSAYLVLGKVTLVAATTGIPEDTLRKWKMASWWSEAEDEIRRSSKLHLSGKLSEVITKTIEQLDDRVTNGDFFYNPRLGTFERKPINASQASKITSELIDKTLLLEKHATQERISEEGLDIRLQKLRDEMVRFAKAKEIKGVQQDELLQLVQEPVSQASSDSSGTTYTVSDSDGSSTPGRQPTPAEGGDGCPGATEGVH